VLKDNHYLIYQQIETKGLLLYDKESCPTTNSSHPYQPNQALESSLALL
jgi:hypothetical protein